ncbi:MAG: glycosyltransferase [Nitrospira sp.]|nr:glycosyltransferase [Candidatus Brocadiales bacterium]MBL7050440.1 glycosyltransferase [Nitrospira sp.]
MKILLLNNFYYDRGGDCIYTFALKNLLEKHGHKVIVFSMHHPRNFDTPDSKYFVSYINYDEEVKHITLYSGMKVISRTIYSFEAKRRLEELIKQEKPDLAHLQNIHHHITPSVFHTLNSQKVPIVWTLHDYTLICPNTSFMSNGRICEKCKKNRYYWPPLERCKKNSFAASTMAAIETTVHRLSRVNSLIDSFIAPSVFLKDKLIEYGFPGEKISHISNYTDLGVQPAQVEPEDYYLYVGRLSSEKGVETLINAAIKSGVSTLKIAGGGPLKEQFISYVKSRGAEDRIQFLGHVTHDEVVNLINRSLFIVFPSECYETFGLAILEAFACHKTVIGTDLGPIPELIKDTETGLLFQRGDVEELSSEITFLVNNPDIAKEMGDKAYEFYKESMSEAVHYEKLIDLYSNIVSVKK